MPTSMEREKPFDVIDLSAITSSSKNLHQLSLYDIDQVAQSAPEYCHVLWIAVSMAEAPVNLSYCFPPKRVTRTCLASKQHYLSV